MRLRELLTEKRRNAPLNKREDALVSLQKYRGQKDVFVSFTSDVGIKSHVRKSDDEPYEEPLVGQRARGEFHNMRGTKLGINPTSEWDTPLGIYAYPIDYVHEKMGHVPFAGDKPYLNIFRATGNLLNPKTYTEEDLQRDLVKLGEVAEDSLSDKERVFAHAMASANVKTPAGKLWNATRLVSDALVNKRNFVAKQEGGKGGKIPVQWNKVMRALGYDGVVNYNNEGIIHSNEPTQAVFFSTTNLKPLDVIFNRKGSHKPQLAQRAIWKQKPHIFANLFKQGKLSEEDIRAAVAFSPSLIDEVGFENLPKSVQDFAIENAEAWTGPDFNALRSIPLSDAKVIQILGHDRHLIRGAKLSPGVAHWVMENILHFVNYFADIQLSPKQWISLVDSYPWVIEYFPRDPSYIDSNVLAAIFKKEPGAFCHTYWKSVDELPYDLVRQSFEWACDSNNNRLIYDMLLKLLMSRNNTSLLQMCLKRAPGDVAKQFAKDAYETANIDKEDYEKLLKLIGE